MKFPSKTNSMNPQLAESDESQSASLSDSGDVTIPALVAAPIVAAISLACWTATIIYYIENTYRPNMGLWALFLMGIAALAVIPVATLAFLLSRLAATSNRGLYAFATALCAGIVLLAIPIVGWAQSQQSSAMFSYGALAALLSIPPSLLGVASSGFIFWLAKSPTSGTAKPE